MTHNIAKGDGDKDIVKVDARDAQFLKDLKQILYYHKP